MDVIPAWLISVHTKVTGSLTSTEGLPAWHKVLLVGHADPKQNGPYTLNLQEFLSIQHFHNLRQCRLRI